MWVGRRQQAAAFVSSPSEVRTSRESEDPDGDALRDWAEAGRRGPDGLYAEHRAAWARLWASGLEVASRPD
eukprot:3510260-Pyramimonas_sp.AAC.1